MVTAVRDRHDGVRRNPWNEVECGHHYARSMSSWALLLASSGFYANVADNQMHFEPLMDISAEDDRFQTFWSTAKA